jgi:hypothetical protein
MSLTLIARKLLYLGPYTRKTAVVRELHDTVKQD